MATAEQTLANDIADWLIEEGPLHPKNDFGKWCSPIERLFFLALALQCKVNVSWFELVPSRDEGYDNTHLQIGNQVSIDGWKVDYLLTVLSDDGVRSHLIVECDGHDYHERTKEQAQRDRERDRRMQEEGYTIYRFTGSELYRGAFGCARQVLRWAENAAWKKEA